MSNAGRNRFEWRLVALGVCLSGLVLFFTRFDTRITGLLPSHLPTVVGMTLFEKWFLPEDEVLVLLEASRNVDPETFRKAVEFIKFEEAMNRPFGPMQASILSAGGDPVAIASTLMSMPSAELEQLIKDSLDQSPDFETQSLALVLRTRLLDGFDIESARAWLDKTVLNLRQSLELESGQIQAALLGRSVFAHDLRVYFQQQLMGSFFSSLGLGLAAGWLLMRSLRPFVFMLGMSLVALAGTLLIIQWIFGAVNGVAIAFGSMVFGLAVDFAILTHTSRVSPSSESWYKNRVYRGMVGGWATTVGVFGILSLSQFPGMRQLGVAVAAGLTFCMVGTILWDRRKNDKEKVGVEAGVKTPGWLLLLLLRNRTPIWMISIFALGIGGVSIFLHRSVLFDFSIKRMEPDIPAQRAMSRMHEALKQDAPPFYLLIGPGDEASNMTAIASLEPVLSKAQVEGVLSEVTIPSLPTLELVDANLSVCRQWMNQKETKNKKSISGAHDSDALSTKVMELVREWTALEPSVVLDLIRTHHPLISGHSGQQAALVVLRPGKNLTDLSSAESLLREIGESNLNAAVHLVSWPLLTKDLARTGGEQAVWMVTASVLLVIVVLVFTVRSMHLACETLVFQFLGLALGFGILAFFNVPWTLMSLPVLVMIFGVSEDYYIHLALASRDGDREELAQTHLAVAACAVTTLMAFAALWMFGGTSLGNLGCTGFVVFSSQAWFALAVYPFWKEKVNESAL